MKAYLIRHSRGNHSPQQVYYNGLTVFEGTKKECRAVLVRMRKLLKAKFAETSTNEKKKEWIAYEMSDIFFVTKIGGNIDFGI
ncbi:hypothetical protein KGQ29_04160 [Patescibacteria group bacterium]|nr:hypothetical protein [Patescibacteria group bacterium]